MIWTILIIIILSGLLISCALSRKTVIVDEHVEGLRDQAKEVKEAWQAFLDAAQVLSREGGTVAVTQHKEVIVVGYENSKPTLTLSYHGNYTRL